MSDVLLKLEGVSKQYDTESEGEIPRVLENVDLEVHSGETVGILGPSGSGKTTLLNIIGALDKPTSGQATLRGKDLSGLNEEQLSDLRNREIGFIFQMHHLLPQLSILENVLVPTLVHDGGEDRSKIEKRAKDLLEKVGLGHRLNYRPGQISGGERQRAAVVRALINQPALLLADEPTGALDQENADSLFDLLLQLNREEGITLICVTHALPLAEKLARVFELRNKRLAPSGEKQGV
ncbi:MAG: ABC transporter ATP-binding protein [Candidatus Omnitrophica bacterium]|nr:ABC transporter ATP-binding protein [Candidatus Omnitrophota bacterium]